MSVSPNPENGETAGDRLRFTVRIDADGAQFIEPEVGQPHAVLGLFGGPDSQSFEIAYMGLTPWQRLLIAEHMAEAARLEIRGHLAEQAKRSGGSGIVVPGRK